MIRVFINPNYFGVPANADNGGIRRVVEAENKHLEKFGVISVPNIQEADVIQNHGGMQAFALGIPSVNTNHGLMWSRQPWGAGMQQVNATLVESMCMAVAHTAPSEWVARAIRRGGFFYPEVIYHGIDADEFAPARTIGNYVLWNKARADYVSDPTDMQRIATHTSDVQFWTTIGEEQANVKVLGVKSFSDMKTIIAGAGLYLCTARETFGIGTLEAMACGVPVVGWDWGGQSEIILSGETGVLVPPGNYDALRDAIHYCFAERKRLSVNCMEDVRLRWRWEPRIEQYAAIFKRVYEDYVETKRPRVSVIVTAYKLDKYLPECLQSVMRQTLQDFECLVIDDAQLESTRAIVEDFHSRDARIQYVPPPEHLGLPGARNFGFSKSKGHYIRHLDADDWLADNALALEATALDNDPQIHISYGHLCMVEADGTVPMAAGAPRRADWPPPAYSWIEQMAHLNQIPSCVMMRREVLLRSGGYRIRNKRQEDADFWCRVTSLGFRAKKVTEAITYFHRSRPDSKGQTEWNTQGKEPDWTAWYPWRVGGRDFREGERLLRKYNGRHPNPKIVPFGAQGKNPEADFWYVHDYAIPIVSIVVTCGPGHKEYLIDALDSIQAQTYPDWECIVVNDTSEKWGKYIPGAPWARVVNMEGNQGTAAARNEGYRHTRGRCIVWMDADDYWLPWFLERMVAHAEQNEGVIYSDLIRDDSIQLKGYYYKELRYEEVPFHMSYAGSSILVPRKVTEAVKKLQGGWDTQIPGMEDWDYQIAVHHLGFCAHHIKEPLFVYRLITSTKRERDYARIKEIEAYLDQKWSQYRKEGVKLMCGCGGGTKVVGGLPKSQYSSSGDVLSSAGVIPEGKDPTQMVQVEYVGPIAEPFSIRSRLDPGINYRFGNNQHDKERTVFLGDAYFLMGMIDGFGRPLYRIKGSSGIAEGRNPEDVVGALAG